MLNDRIARAVAEEASLPFLDLLSRRVIDPGAASALPEATARTLGVIPVQVVDGTLTVAMANPFDQRKVAALDDLLGSNWAAVVASAKEITAARRLLYSGGLEGYFAAEAEAEVPPTPADGYAGAGDFIDGSFIDENDSALDEALLRSGIAQPDELRSALDYQERFGGPLTEALVHVGAATETEVAHAVARALGLGTAELGDDQPRDDEALMRALPEDLVRRHRVIPVAISEGTLTIALSDPGDEEALAAVRTATPMRLRMLVTTAKAIDETIRIRYGEYDLSRAINQLRLSEPANSAHQVVSRPQMLVIALGVLAVVAGAVIDPLTTFVVINVLTVLVYVSLALQRVLLIQRSLTAGRVIEISDEDLDELDERTLPTVTVLVPLLREGEVVPRLIESLSALDYPSSRLDVRLLVEEDDLETAAALDRAPLPVWIQRVTVPDSQPKTKPKACNFGLLQAQGEFVVIYDAEDQPEPDQLRKIASAFTRVPDQVACIQCKLGYFNLDQNVLTRWFACEYATWFDLVLPGLSATDAPVPLGGTSNHFRTETLLELGGWDPFNVTEDADLGVRLHKAGLRTMVLDSYTMEEANSDIGNWVRQRSRWIKGYMQTWLVHMRHPIRLYRGIGLRGFLSFQATIGGTPLVILLAPLYWTLTTSWALTHAGVIKSFFPGAIYYIAGAALIIGNFGFAYGMAVGAATRGRPALVRWALLTPAYWVLMSVAAWRGLFQLVRKPFYWEKTTHGLDL